MGREGRLRAAFQEGNSTQMRTNCSQLRELAFPLGERQGETDITQDHGPG